MAKDRANAVWTDESRLDGDEAGAGVVVGGTGRRGVTLCLGWLRFFCFVFNQFYFTCYTQAKAYGNTSPNYPVSLRMADRAGRRSHFGDNKEIFEAEVYTIPGPRWWLGVEERE